MRGEPLSRDTVVSQLGPPWPDRPRPHTREQDVSMIRGGELTVERAVYYVNPRRSPADNDSLRSATVGELEDAGFTVRATPSRHNPDHVSVYYDGEWGDTVAERFDSVLGEPPAGESPHE